MAKMIETPRKRKTRPKRIVPTHIEDFVRQIRDSRAIEKKALEEARTAKDKRISLRWREQAMLQRKVQKWLARAAKERMRLGNP